MLVYIHTKSGEVWSGLFNAISTFMGYLMPCLCEKRSGTI